MMCQNLLHLPIVRKFCMYPTLDVARATNLLVKTLCLDHVVVATKTSHCRGGHVRLSWLREVYKDACANRQWTIIARTYLLYLVSCTIFVIKV